mmetsp:Transcript_1136/g.2610  ORF Transcript_1136/g.2610 Transcript_1136/m.2610 type:complete len:216 (+) Transcript_1136:518-1165(+)
MVTSGSTSWSPFSILWRKARCHGRNASCSPEVSECATFQTAGSVCSSENSFHLPASRNAFTALLKRDHSSQVISLISLRRFSPSGGAARTPATRKASAASNARVSTPKSAAEARLLVLPSFPPSPPPPEEQGSKAAAAAPLIKGVVVVVSLFSAVSCRVIRARVVHVFLLSLLSPPPLSLFSRARGVQRKSSRRLSNARNRAFRLVVTAAARSLT